MAIEPVSVSDASTVDHQNLLDRFYGLFKGAEEYVAQHLPEHELKPQVVTNLHAAWDNTVAAIRADLAKVEAAAKAAGTSVVADAETAAEGVVAAAVPAVEDAAQTVVTSAQQAVTDVASTVTPTTATETTAQ